MSRALAAVRGCRFLLTTDLKPGQLPFVGESATRKIVEILSSIEADGEGTCTDLEAFR